MVTYPAFLDTLVRELRVSGWRNTRGAWVDPERPIIRGGDRDTTARRERAGRVTDFAALGVGDAIEGSLARVVDPCLGLSISRVDPLPYHVKAVYDYQLKEARVRFLRADDGPPPIATMAYPTRAVHRANVVGFPVGECPFAEAP